MFKNFFIFNPRVTAFAATQNSNEKRAFHVFTV